VAPWSWPKFAVYRDAQRSFSDVALWYDDMFTLTDGEAERVPGEMVSERYLSTLGVRPAVGRDFPAGEDDHGGAARLVLISDALSSRRFNADPGAIGRTVDVDREPFEVVGVLPPGFRGRQGAPTSSSPLLHGALPI
jgi:hypothetical protein